MKVKNLIVGAGLAGLTLAERLANVKKQGGLAINLADSIPICTR